MALHEQGRLSSASGLELNPTFPIDPVAYSGMLPQTTLRSLPTTAVTTGIGSGTATTLATITQANVSGSAVADILVRVACNSNGHVFDSTRVGKYTLAISRVAGSALVATLSLGLRCGDCNVRIRHTDVQYRPCRCIRRCNRNKHYSDSDNRYRERRIHIRSATINNSNEQPGLRPYHRIGDYNARLQFARKLCWWHHV